MVTGKLDHLEQIKIAFPKRLLLYLKVVSERCPPAKLATGCEGKHQQNVLSFFSLLKAIYGISSKYCIAGLAPVSGAWLSRFRLSHRLLFPPIDCRM